MLMSYFMVVLLLWLSFIGFVTVVLSILENVFIVIILLIMSRVLQRVKTRKGKFNILIIMTINVTYIGIL